MIRQHHTGFTRAILNSTQRLLRSSKNNNILASNHIDARTLKDIGVSTVGMF